MVLTLCTVQWPHFTCRKTKCILCRSYTFKC